jgi:hypothetical protein
MSTTDWIDTSVAEWFDRGDLVVTLFCFAVFCAMRGLGGRFRR